MNPDTPDDVEIGYSSSRIRSLVALATTTTLLSASTACDWFGLGGGCGYHAPVILIGLASFGVANELIRFDATADVSTCEYRPRKNVALRITQELEWRLFALHQYLYANEVIGVERFGIGGLAARHKAVKAGAAPEQKVITPSQRIALCA
jgi:hypothetical protein